MLHQVFGPRPVTQDGSLQIPGDVELVIAREDNLRDLLFLVPLGDQVTPENFEPTLTGPDLFPEIGGAMSPPSGSPGFRHHHCHPD